MEGDMHHITNRAGVTRRGIILAALVAFGSGLVLPAGALAVAPTDGGSLDMTVYPISLSTAVDSYDPHVSGDLVSYTADSTIRYYSFFTGADAQVPNDAGETHFLSDVSGERVAFGEFAVGARIMVFDTGKGTLTEFDPLWDSARYAPAIGSDTVAYITGETALFPNDGGQLYAGHLGGASQLVTDGARANQSAQVAPQGEVVVYESCPFSDSTNCDIHQASWTGSSWVVAELTSNAVAEANPDTDGAVVVYDAVRNDERDIAWQPVGGGAEVVLELPGLQGNPAVSAGVISFESASESGGAADVYAYDIASNRLFRITTTPAQDSLTDIFRGLDGRIRLVWTEDASGNRDVYGATFEIPAVEPPTYSFGGFQQPVDPRPTLNSMKAGAAVPVKFSLGGDRGLDIFAAGSPKSEAIACESGADVDGVEQTVSAGGSSLAYDALTDTYSYVWKTDKAWAGKCRQLVLAFSDGSMARANFKFK